MCGRFSLSIPLERLREIFLSPGDPAPALPAEPVLRPPRYNICPTQHIPVIRREKGNGRRSLAFLHWGLVPSWARDRAIGARLINARAETVGEKPAFRAAFRRRRCLVPSDGFFEWKKRSRGGKTPWLIRFRDRRVFAFAGLWERWEGGEGPPLESCTILTTRPNPLVKKIHNRMPVILDEGNHDAWMDPEREKGEDIETFLEPYPDGAMTAFPVDPKVNLPGNDLPECIEPADPGPSLFG